MNARHLRFVAITTLALATVAATLIAAAATGSHSSAPGIVKIVKGGDPDAGTLANRPGPSGPEAAAADEYRQGVLAYPKAKLDVRWGSTARQTFARIASRTKTRTSFPNPNLFDVWQLFGPATNATEPAVLNFSGAEAHTGSRTASIAISPTCGAGGPTQFACRMWVGPVGGGVWRTDDATASDPVWTQVGANDLGINSIGEIVLDPNDPSEQTIYAGTGEPNNCSSGCEAGVGLYRSTNGGNSWAKLPDICVNGANLCATPGVDAFLGRGISEVVIEPGNSNHIFVGTANAIRSMSHVIEGPDAQVRLEPGANAPGLYESTNGGATFTLAWDPYPNPATTPLRRGVIDIGLDPLDSRVVYASAIARGVYRRCVVGVATPACGGEAAPNSTTFAQVFSPRHTSPLGRERTHFDLTVKNSATRIYLTTGELGGSPFAGEAASSFWRIDNAALTAAALLGTEPAGAATPPAGNGNPFPATYAGWQILTANTTASPYWATRNFCEPQCWYDQDVFTPKDLRHPATGPGLLPDTVYVIGSFQYGELPCTSRGVGCGSGISNGRAILYSDTAGDPDPAWNNRTFTDMSFDFPTLGDTWCAYHQIGTPCLFTYRSVHPDQHEVVINPSNPTQFFEGSDGALIRSSGKFGGPNLPAGFEANQCLFRAAPTAGVPALSGNSLIQCQRVLSRVPRNLQHINTRIGSTLQFVGVAVDPKNPCIVIGGTQDNGTWMPTFCGSDDFTQVIYGDGGDPGFDSYYDQSAVSNNESWVFNGYTGGATNVNFHSGKGAGDLWLDVFYPQLLSGEGFDFYWPQTSDPNPPFFNGQRTHPIYSGGQSVWRSWAWGAGTQGAVPQDVVPNIPWYEANCPDLYVTPTTCGDFRAMGGPGGPNSTSDLTGTNFGADRQGLFVSWVSRRAADTTNLWATTGAGRVFLTKTADAANPANVVWYRLDSLPTPGFSGNCPLAGGGMNPTPPPGGAVNCSPDRHPNGIYPDPANPNIAYIAYSGYNAATPGTPGHLFRVTISNDVNGVPNGATFTNLGVEAGTGTFPTPTATGDLPVNDVAMNDSNGVLYAATDYGVLKGTPAGGGTFAWATTPGMPRYEITHLAITPGQRDACRVCGTSRLLYAATHSQGIWLMRLS